MEAMGLEANQKEELLAEIAAEKWLIKRWGRSGIWTRDLLHPKQES